MAPKTPVKKLTPEQVNALLKKLEAASELGAEDYAILADIVRTWAHLCKQAKHGTLGRRELQRILGLLAKRRSTGGAGSSNTPGSSSEPPGGGATGQGDVGGSTAAPAEGEAQAEEDKRQKQNRDPHGRRGPDDFTGLAQQHHQHGDLAVGCTCPGCGRGKLYEDEPSVFTSIAGQAPFSGMTHVVQRLRCGLCKEVFVAPLPEELERDGVSGLRLYSYSAVAVVSIYRYFGGMPLFRQQTLQAALGTAVPDSSMADLCERMANAAGPLARYLRELTRSASGFFGDDTGALILESRTALREQRSTGRVVERTGCHTSCVIAVTAAGQRVAVFKTGIQHTGELMDELLAGRDPTLPVPFFMADCHACNTVTVCRVLYAGCNAHAVRRFRAVEERYPEEAAFARERYTAIFDNEERCKEANLTPDERLAFHREHSKPLFDEICEHGEALVEAHALEPNSDLGEAYGFVVNNRVRLSAFLRHPGVPLENNIVERQLRVPVRLRDNAPFFVTGLGSKIADTVWTVGATALAHGVNLLDYFTALQRYAADVRAHPELWVPWDYLRRIRELDGADPPDRQDTNRRHRRPTDAARGAAPVN